MKKPSENESSTPSDEFTDLTRRLDSGDIILFDRNCFKMSPFGCFICTSAKILSNWDHVGLVHKKIETFDNGVTKASLWVLEANFGGVTCRPLEERVKRSHSHRIAVRPLDHLRTQEDRDRLQQFIDAHVGMSYKQSSTMMVSAIVDPPDKQERERIHSLIVSKESKLQDVSQQLRDPHITPFQVTSLMFQKQSLLEQLFELQSALNDMKGNGVMVPSVEGTNDRSKGTFCSELVVAAYQAMGLLDAYPAASTFKPVDFTSEGEAAKPGVLSFIVRDVKLLAEEFLRGSSEPNRFQLLDYFIHGSVLSRMSDSKAAISLNNKKPAPDEFETRQILSRALHRTPLFDLLESDESRRLFMRSFQRRVVRRGTVLYREGEPNDGMYVVERGLLKRYVASLHPTKAIPYSVSHVGAGSCCGVNPSIFPATKGANVKRAATVVATEDTIVWHVDVDTIKHYVTTSRAAQVEKQTRKDRRALEEMLKRHFLFRRRDHVHPEELQAFFKVHFTAGDEMWHQGGGSDVFYILVEGEAERIIDGRLRNTLRAGQSFGELGILFDAPRGATMRAKTDCVLWGLRAEQFYSLRIGEGAKGIADTFRSGSTFNAARNESEMTFDRFLLFLGITNVTPEDSLPDRQQAFLHRLVTNNRSTSNVTFWDYIRFDIMINAENAVHEAMFRLIDIENTGRVRFSDLQMFLGDHYGQAAQLDAQNGNVTAVFGKTLEKRLTFDDFSSRATQALLPKSFSRDVEQLREKIRFATPERHAHLVSSPVFHADEDTAELKGPSHHGDQLLSAYMYRNTSMGLVAMITMLVFYPLERATIVRQVNATKKWGKLFPSDLRVLYRGCPLALFRCGLSVTIFSCLLNRSTAWLNAPRAPSGSPGPEQHRLVDRLRWDLQSVHPYYGFIVSCFACGLVANTITYPIDVIRVVQTTHGVNLSAREALWAIRNNGSRFFRGFTLTTLGVFPFVGVNWAMYYELIVPLLYPVYMYRNSSAVAQAQEGLGSGTHHPNVGQYCAPCAVVAVAMHSLVMHPLDVFRRQQQARSGHGGRDKFKWRQMGRGLGMQMARVVPAAAFSVMLSRHVDRWLEPLAYPKKQ
eukprot:PhM_4_TR14162/c1_g3_i1/m.99588